MTTTDQGPDASDLDKSVIKTRKGHALAANLSASAQVRPLTLFVNVEPEVLDTAPMDDLLAIAQAAPGQLRVVLEITKRALAVRPADLLRTVERVRALGWGARWTTSALRPCRWRSCRCCARTS